MPYTCYEYYTDDISKALRRSQAWYRRLNEIGEFHIYSRNRVFPLTDDEQTEIIDYLAKRNFPYKIIFHDPL